MKLVKLFLVPILLLIMSSCSSVRVATDYDTKVDFDKYKTFAFYKKGIDKASISDLDKKRIMRAIESELLAKGMTKSSNPDILISLFTKSRERVNITDNSFNGFYYPWYYGVNPVTVSQYTEGTLFIDLIEAKNKELVWQGIGTGALRMHNIEKKEARIKEFVAKIMSEYPPHHKK
ncbi:DUF4136 domain-containing protein [Tenacibaculum maritimum]|uniref:DUF4136 domain-containing protein n=1 Tax=Tenacibaculum maritimum TaxID=107401 RepID=UPI0012E5AF1E|nr:DUF4136 domain-containing protein [Tenacibaculum maritimum]MCD9581874.1 DUF4136 domain-containing protein [Tenacibaculum maritimum]MCD9635365.1 DUF4136 domain-containing protein [Tenacibaculum maritimum]CAA0198686.1 Probable lipoprotein precursor [Tenacibaculum maritimum]CAA0220553.1 Probable lipoprotein precursor [Tenacibaculum maritimum]CAA0254010.1 Probable lipoprotein precursor [Tenacibaculum maritimum]